MKPKQPHAFKGLTTTEAHAQQKIYGDNTIYHKKQLRPLVAFLKKLDSPLILLLMGASLVSAFLGQTVNASIIFAMILVSAILDYYNSAKSEQVAAKLMERVSSTATVLRDGERIELPFHAVVPRDIIEFSSGDIIPADCRVLVSDDFFVNQSSLTGESFPVEKSSAVGNETQKMPEENKTLSISDETLVFMGSNVVTGYGTAIVLRIGEKSEFGKIAQHLSATDQETSFEKGIRNFSYYIMRLTFAMVTVVFFVNAYLGRPLIDSFLFAIAIAVGLTPEMLPLIMSVALSRGSLVMSKKEVIVKNLSAIQNFGGMNILCTDKTGTLTEDRVSLMKCVDVAGGISAETLTYMYLGSIFHTARKNPLDEAVEHSGKVDISMYTKVDEIPFDFHRRRDSVVVDNDSERTMITKGAPGGILSASAFIYTGKSLGVQPMTDEFRTQARAQYDALSDEGFRVLALATKKIPQEVRDKYKADEEEGMVFMGFGAFLDPIKQGSAEAMRQLNDLGIEVKIITGDSEILTTRICKELGIVVRGVLVGKDMENYSDSELSVKIKDINIFARVSPEQKERIVLLLRKAGNTVGYMGDGINDAPVLKSADVGISVNNAVDVAKETAHIILLTKSLSVLKDGVVEGRKTFKNTLKYIKIGLSSNFGNMFSMMGASAFLPFLPMLPSQILLNNFLYDMSQTSLPTDNVDVEDIQKPVRWDTKYFSKYIMIFGFLSSVFDFVTFYLLYKVFAFSASGFQTGWFIESLGTQVLIVYIIRTKRFPAFRSLPSIGVVATTLSIVAVAWILPFTSIAKFLGFEALPLVALGAIAGLIFVYLIFGELVKAFFYHRYKEAL